MLPNNIISTRRPLDTLNFFLADVRDGLSRYLAIYLLMPETGPGKAAADQPASSDASPIRSRA